MCLLDYTSYLITKPPSIELCISFHCTYSIGLVDVIVSQSFPDEIVYSHVSIKQSVSAYTAMSMGYDDNLQSPVDRRSQLLVVQTSLISLATFIVALRLFTRFFVLKSPGWDDLAISIGLVSPRVL